MASKWMRQAACSFGSGETVKESVPWAAFLARRSVVPLVATVLVTTLSACGSASTSGAGAGSKSSGSATGSQATNVKVQIYPGAIWSVPIEAAQSQGYFAKHGIKAEFIPATTGPAAIAALASGSVDTISVSPEVIMGAISSGLQARVWAGTMKNPWVILANKKVQLATTSYPGDLKALKGLTVGVPAIPSAGQGVLEASLLSVGLKPTDVKYVSVGIGPSSLAALETGQIQALVIQQPIAEKAIKATGATILADPSKGQLPPNLQGAYLGQWSLASYVSAHAEVIRNMHAALADAYAWLTNPGNTAAVSAFLQKTYNTTGLDYTQMAKSDVGLWNVDYTNSALSTWDAYDVQYGFLKKSIDTSNLLVQGP